jgi:hypothetical protein
MKKNLLLIALLFVFGSTFAQHQAAVLNTAASTNVKQEVPPTSAVQLNDDMSIMLNTALPVMATYKVDVKHYASNMSDQRAADSFVKQFERPNVSCKVNAKTNVLTITLKMTGETSTWTAEQWNEHLKSN